MFILNINVGSKYITTNSYEASPDAKDEISFPQGATIDVLHKLMDGWWVIKWVDLSLSFIFGIYWYVKSCKVNCVNAIYVIIHVCNCRCFVMGKFRITPRTGYKQDSAILSGMSSCMVELYSRYVLVRRVSRI